MASRLLDGKFVVGEMVHGGEMTINHEGQHVTVILPPNHLATNEISTKTSTHHHIQLF